MTKIQFPLWVLTFTSLSVFLRRGRAASSPMVKIKKPSFRKSWNLTVKGLKDVYFFLRKAVWKQQFWTGDLIWFYVRNLLKFFRLRHYQNYLSHRVKIGKTSRHRSPPIWDLKERSSSQKTSMFYEKSIFQHLVNT